MDLGQQAATSLAPGKLELAIFKIRHPYYINQIADWELYRYAFKGGSNFVLKYLKKFSTLETEPEFSIRRAVTYCPAHAKAAVNEIKNSISERLVDVIREGGPASYNEAISGENGGIDQASNSMDSFLSKHVIPDLLVIGKVGIYIDKPPVFEDASLLESSTARPYVYTYRAEDILTWTYNQYNVLTKVLLLDTVETTDSVNGLVSGTKTQIRYLSLEEDGVHVDVYDEDGEQENSVLKLSRIPFVIAEISESLMCDIAAYQIALLNLGSSDINYALRSNFPFYTEQYSPQADLAGQIMKKVDSTGAEVATDTSMKVGAAAGRRYPINTERPGYIHPSPEPLRASMDKQEQLKTEIRQLVALALTNIKPTRASSDSKEKDNQGLESGLAAIGMELELLERQISEIWSEYEGASESATIIYPDKYSMRTDDDRRKEAKELLEDLPKVPSLIYQKEVAKRVVSVLLSRKVDDSVIKSINDEIDAATVINIDPEVIAKDIENQLVSNETASLARLYPKGETEKAAKDHAERATRIAAAQSAGKIDSAARGVTDLSADSTGAKDEKTTTQAAAMQTEGGKAVRT